MTGISHLAEKGILTFSSFPAHFIFTLMHPVCVLSPLSPLLFLRLCTVFFGIPLLCASQGKAALSWDTLNYLRLSPSITRILFSSSLRLRGSFGSMQDTLLLSAEGMGPNLLAQANELSSC
ncbi:hypothetical protein PBY51_014304 [Eleginops maclovinus]|uniref:Uncharacterized protein n=1 Tax=Eleginops maclovinus TaxID=56733 RepID=A0AAN8A4I2_ELEMC|nr:hypothetical protein PBY51_014304 [Eleginops maclovinus]